MSNTVLLLDKQRYLGGGVPKFQVWYRRAQEAQNPLIKKNLQETV